MIEANTLKRRFTRSRGLAESYGIGLVTVKHCVESGLLRNVPTICVAHTIDFAGRYPAKLA